MERLFDKVLVTGGAGYCGARLIPQMLARGYKVTVFDIMFFGNQFLPRDNPNLRIIDGDIRDAGAAIHGIATELGTEVLRGLCNVNGPGAGERQIRNGGHRKGGDPHPPRKSR